VNSRQAAQGKGSVDTAASHAKVRRYFEHTSSSADGYDSDGDSLYTRLSDIVYGRDSRDNNGTQGKGSVDTSAATEKEKEKGIVDTSAATEKEKGSVDTSAATEKGIVDTREAQEKEKGSVDTREAQEKEKGSVDTNEAKGKGSE
jgi:hypothetical protein